MKPVIFLACLLVACDAPVEKYVTPEAAKGNWVELGTDTKVVRLEYPDAICFVSDGYKSGGISCYRKEGK